MSLTRMGFVPCVKFFRLFPTLGDTHYEVKGLFPWCRNSFVFYLCVLNHASCLRMCCTYSDAGQYNWTLSPVFERPSIPSGPLTKTGMRPEAPNIQKWSQPHFLSKIRTRLFAGYAPEWAEAHQKYHIRRWLFLSRLRPRKFTNIWGWGTKSLSSSCQMSQERLGTFLILNGPEYL
jgi:hypothetical protein